MNERVEDSTIGGAMMTTGKSGTSRGLGRGFTLIELLVAIIVIGTLVGLLIVGLNKASRFAKARAAQQTMSSLKAATTQFKAEFGFLPPLVYDGTDMGRDASQVQVESFSNAGPVYTDSFGRTLINVYQLGNADTRAFLRGDFLTPSGGNPDYRDPRYSKFSLPFYVAGALGKEVDGVEGPGMSKPQADGSWAGIGDALGGGNKTFDAFMDTGKSASRLERGYIDANEVDELGGTTPGDLANRLALVDANGKAYRYYRWLPNQNPANTLELNIPGVLLDPVIHRDALGDPTIDVTDGDVKLRGATWAIVGAGQNKVFGTENITELRDLLGMSSTTAEAIVRREAASDNIVEVGE